MEAAVDEAEGVPHAGLRGGSGADAEQGEQLLQPGDHPRLVGVADLLEVS